MNTTATHLTREMPPRQSGVVAIALLGLIAVYALALGNGPASNALAVVIGGFAGIALYHASFGFTAAWRKVVTERRGAGLRAQMILFAVACVISYSLLDYGDLIGLRTYGFAAPWGVGSAVGAFMFGVGMQLGGSCASGTLFTSGGGSSRMMITLAFFVIGSGIGTAHLHWWAALPAFPAFSYVNAFGAPGAIAITLTVLGAIYLWTVRRETRAWGAIEPLGKTESLISGPWSKLAGALALAAVSIATLLVLQRPWGITSGFALWGAKLFQSVGIPAETWPYWSGGRLASLTGRSVFADSTSVMNFGIVLGAMIAAGLAGKYRPTAKIEWPAVATAIIGGLLMGYGARLAYGCNIGAYLGGVVSGSIHGWWWLIFGFMGSVAGTRLKQRLKL